MTTNLHEAAAFALEQFQRAEAARVADDFRESMAAEDEYAIALERFAKASGHHLCDCRQAVETWRGPDVLLAALAAVVDAGLGVSRRAA